MAPEEFKNLGFANEEKPQEMSKHAGGATANSVRDDGLKIT
jgi:hypothetical protein